MLDRRRFLTSAAVLGGSLRVGAAGWLLHRVLRSSPASAAEANESRRALRVLGRVTYGPRPGDLDRVLSSGVPGFIEEQLAPESISDWRTRFSIRRRGLADLAAPGIFDFPASEVLPELRRATLLRAVFSERQLFELMVEFWTDHFHIDAHKGDGAWLKVIDDREVIRRHALGSYRDLLRASVESPAMLVYLDGVANVRGKPNENHARELLERHSLGLDGGYSEGDVKELARALTGWRLRRFLGRGGRVLDRDHHDSLEKVVLGTKLSGGPEAELEQIIDRLASHPATARHIARKLCRRFVGGEPSDGLTGRVARTFSDSKGDIRTTLRQVLFSGELVSSPPKLKRPFTYMVSALRAVGADCDGGEGIQRELEEMGQPLFGWPTPDGPPEEDEPWSGRFLSRWNFALKLCSNRIPGISVPAGVRATEPARVLERILLRPAAPHEAHSVALAGDEALALVLCHPDFQLH